MFEETFLCRQNFCFFHFMSYPLLRPRRWRVVASVTGTKCFEKATKTVPKNSADIFIGCEKVGTA
jgi:hypothetical protein